MVRCILAAVVCCFALASGLRVGGRRGLWCNFARRPKRSPCARDVGGLTMAAPKHSTPYVRSSQVSEGKLAAVVAEITGVAESVKHVQEEIDEVGVKIEDIKTKLEQPNLSVRKEDLLAVEFKSLLDKEAALRCEKQSLLDKESHQDGPVLQWGAERVVLAPDPVNWESIKLGDVVTVPMGHSGLNDDEPSSQKLYVRRACLDLYKFLSESSENMLLVVVPGSASQSRSTLSPWSKPNCAKKEYSTCTVIPSLAFPSSSLTIQLSRLRGSRDRPFQRSLRPWMPLSTACYAMVWLI